MRYFTYSVGAYLVNELDIAGAVDKILHDGRDIIYLRLVTGEKLMIHLIDSYIPLYEIKNTVTQNTANGDHTLFILWADMLLPDHGRMVELEDWHRGLMALFDGRIYAYKRYMQKLYVFPVHFDAIPYSAFRRVRYGEPIDVGALRCYHAEVEMDGLRGGFYATSFDGDPDAYHRQRADHIETPINVDQLAGHFAVLGLSVGADKAAVKAAFRERARQVHPDINTTDTDAHQKMQALNIAYQTILKAIERGDAG
ncbi:MAG: hypothetical protein EA396_07695 [Anaerolineaceae bacterium]|nr:MAG: hypothetical protein EA396_07695 [Anaerolineaceae bacterium]